MKSKKKVCRQPKDFVDGMKRAVVIASEVRAVVANYGSIESWQRIDKAIRLIEQEIRKFETEVDKR